VRSNDSRGGGGVSPYHKCLATKRCADNIDQVTWRKSATEGSVGFCSHAGRQANRNWSRAASKATQEGEHKQVKTSHEGPSGTTT
jgi:hypothetical protein